MAIQSKEEHRAEQMSMIRDDALGKMNTVIANCNTILKELALPKKDIPNIITAYNNRILIIEKEFKKAGIDYYDREQCETRFIIENRMQATILFGKDAISKYLAILSNISKEQKKDFINIAKNIHKKPKAVKKAMKNRQHPLLSNEQIDNSNKALQEYLDCYDKVADFSITNDIIEAILFYKVLASTRCIENFDSRIDSINDELIKLGYPSIKNIVSEQIKKQDLSFANIRNLKQVSIPAKILSFPKK